MKSNYKWLHPTMYVRVIINDFMINVRENIPDPEVLQEITGVHWNIKSGKTRTGGSVLPDESSTDQTEGFIFVFCV